MRDDRKQEHSPTPPPIPESQRAVPPKQKRHSNKVPLVILVGFFGIFGWAFLLPHRSSSNGPVSLEKADGCPIPLPETAKNIRWYTEQWAVMYKTYVRFEAPPQDCVNHINTVKAYWEEEWDTSLGNFQPPGPIEEPSYDRHFYSDPYSPAWFEPNTIDEGVTAGGGGTGVPMVWVDTQRGIFYYEISD